MEPGRVGRPGLSVQCPVVEGTTSVPAPVTTPALATEEISVLAYTLRKRCATHTPVTVRSTHARTHPSIRVTGFPVLYIRTVITLQLVYHDNYSLINTVPVITLLSHSREGCERGAYWEMEFPCLFPAVLGGSPIVSNSVPCCPIMCDDRM